MLLLKLGKVSVSNEVKEVNALGWIRTRDQQILSVKRQSLTLQRNT